MKTQKQIIGDLGEGIACNYLKDKGFCIAERNYWKPWGEIDIVAEKQDKIYFIEVKTVSYETSKHLLDKAKQNVSCETDENNKKNVSYETKNGYLPEDNIHAWKLKRLSRVIQSYLLERFGENDIDWQLDVVCVYVDLKNKTARVEYLDGIL